MPLLFAGHGSPMNAIEQNDFSRGWAEVATRMPRPKAILSVSAHWYIDRTRVLSSRQPRTIHDFWGFPEELYRARYPAPGAPELAERAAQMIDAVSVEPDDSWGLDHGTWSVLTHMYPEADIPVFQLSIDHALTGEEHYRIGTQLQALRQEGVLILGSGNLVHNLARVDWSAGESGYPWAEDFQARLRDLISGGEHQELMEYEKLGPEARLSIPISDHYVPLLYVLGAGMSSEAVTIFNDNCVLGSVSMMCVTVGDLSEKTGKG